MSTTPVTWAPRRESISRTRWTMPYVLAPARITITTPSTTVLSTLGSVTTRQGAASKRIWSYSVTASAMIRRTSSDPRSSAGLGGMGPADMTEKLGSTSWTTRRQSACPTRAELRP
ncbi:MAG: hypothetical protein NT031_02315 [Planctomycetota bacterium]|nr:hypothetical protein [Planctomycetota bacterium]